MSSKWILDLNLQVQIIKLLEDNIGSNPCDLGLGKKILLWQQKHNKRKKINKLDFSKD